VVATSSQSRDTVPHELSRWIVVLVVATPFLAHLSRGGLHAESSSQDGGSSSMNILIGIPIGQSILLMLGWSFATALVTTPLLKRIRAHRETGRRTHPGPEPGGVH
jgi:hypothetical protein